MKKPKNVEKIKKSSYWFFGASAVCLVISIICACLHKTDYAIIAAILSVIFLFWAIRRWCKYTKVLERLESDYDYKPCRA